jgi:hypothetical protein
MDALTDCTFIHMNQVQVIRHVAIMSDREQVYVSGSWLRQCWILYTGFHSGNYIADDNIFISYIEWCIILFYVQIDCFILEFFSLLWLLFCSLYDTS